MTNKDYKRLTLRNPVVTGRFSGKTLLNRLTALENAIDDDTLVFLPCKVGDTFWLVGKPNLDVLGEIGDTGIYERKVAEIWIWEHSVNLIDQYGGDFSIEMVYFSKEAAEKALEEMKKCQNLQ